MRRATAFTLLELLAVTAVMTLIVTTVGLRYAESVRRGSDQGVLEEAAWLERTTRRAAIQTGRPQTLIFGLDDQSIARSSDQGGGVLVRLPDSIRMDELLTPDRQYRREPARIEIGPLGRSPTYAVRWVADDGEESWMLVVGMTGEVRWMKSESDVRALMKLLRDRL
jgi:type II secretory pathway pseudopilin PulG